MNPDLSFLDPLEAKASGEADVARVFGLEHPIVDVTPDEILSLRPQIEAAIEAKVAEERERIVAWLASLEKSETPPASYAWVVGGDDDANADGWISAHCLRHGEFNVPLFRSTVLSRLIARSSHLEKQP